MIYLIKPMISITTSTSIGTIRSCVSSKIFVRSPVDSKKSMNLLSRNSLKILSDEYAVDSLQNLSKMTVIIYMIC